MKRWLVWTLVLCIATSLSVVAAINFGRLDQSSDPFTALGIAECNKLPCVQGVTPGVTSWDYVTSHFGRAGGGRVFADTVEIGTNTLAYTAFTSDSKGETVDSIMLYSVNHLLLGTIMDHYGTPCKLRVYASGGIQLIYPQLTADLDISLLLPYADTTLSAETRVGNLVFPSTPNSCEFEQSNPANVFNDKYWRGFMDLDKYYQN